MTTYRKCMFHIVFATLNREPVLTDARRKELYSYIWGICKKMECHLYRVGGYRDHVHMLVDVHPAVSLAEFVRAVKINSSRWIRGNGAFPLFRHWQEGYAAFTLNYAEKDRIIKYIKGQEDHHRRVTFLDEFKQMLDEIGMTLDEAHLP